MEHRNSACCLHNIAVLRALICPSAQNGCFGSNAIVSASWVLAEVDLDAASFVGDSARRCCGRICAGNDNPLLLILKGMVRWLNSESTHLCGTARRKGDPGLPPFGFPALLDWSGGCGTRASRSDSPRRHPLTSLRYSAAHRGKKIKTKPTAWALRAHAKMQSALRRIVCICYLISPSQIGKQWQPHIDSLILSSNLSEIT
jgi:hypothetical protein